MYEILILSQDSVYHKIITTPILPNVGDIYAWSETERLEVTHRILPVSILKKITVIVKLLNQ